MMLVLRTSYCKKAHTVERLLRPATEAMEKKLGHKISAQMESTFPQLLFLYCCPFSHLRKLTPSHPMVDGVNLKSCVERQSHVENWLTQKDVHM